MYKGLKNDYPIQMDYVEMAKNGNEEAIEQLYKLYAVNMFNTCVKMCGDTDLAKDIFQDAFLKALRNIGQLKNNNSFGGWLKRVVINECISNSRKTKLHVAYYDEELPEVSEEETDWMTKVTIEKVHAEIKKLPDGCRQVFVLFAVEDYQHKEIASMLGISESTSKSQYQRARSLLKKRILNDLHG